MYDMILYFVMVICIVIYIWFSWKLFNENDAFSKYNFSKLIISCLATKSQRFKLKKQIVTLWMNELHERYPIMDILINIFSKSNIYSCKHDYVSKLIRKIIWIVVRQNCFEYRITLEVNGINLFSINYLARKINLQVILYGHNL